MEPIEPTLEPLFAMTLTVAPPTDVGRTPVGHRRVVPVTGGRIDGPRLKATVLPGEDWIVERADGAFEIDVRMPIKSDDGAMILMRYTGLRHGPPEVLARLGRGEPVDPKDYFLRILLRFETAAPPYDWLNRVLAVGSGARSAASVLYRVWAIG
ncbi:MAG: DUF3237 domain-containing protein [Rhodospirillales bacterium]|nr:DUF3237 domain-containing protein [Rhodospirillales bacterium]